MALQNDIKVNKNGKFIPTVMVAAVTYIFYNIFLYLKVSTTHAVLCIFSLFGFCHLLHDKQSNDKHRKTMGRW